jgi:hypothetical protein
MSDSTPSDLQKRYISDTKTLIDTLTMLHLTAEARVPGGVASPGHGTVM